jgi:hypothetical protein
LTSPVNSPGALDRDEFVPEDAGTDDLDGAAQDDVDAECRRSLVVEDLARDRMPPLAVARDPQELSVVQRGEHLLPAFCDDVVHGAGF